MKTTPKVNKLAQILQIYGALNAAAGAGIAVMLWTSGELEFAAAFAQFAETLVSSFLVIAVGEIIQLLYLCVVLALLCCSSLCTRAISKPLAL